MCCNSFDSRQNKNVFLTHNFFWSSSIICCCSLSPVFGWYRIFAERLNEYCSKWTTLNDEKIKYFRAFMSQKVWQNELRKFRDFSMFWQLKPSWETENPKTIFNDAMRRERKKKSRSQLRKIFLTVDIFWHISSTWNYVFLPISHVINFLEAGQ